MNFLPHECIGMACSKMQSWSLVALLGTRVRLLPLKMAMGLQSREMTLVPLRSRLPMKSSLERTW